MEILNFQSEQGPGGPREVRILLQMLLDELGPDWKAEHLLEDQLEDLVHSIIVKDNFSTVTNFIYDRQPDGVAKKERQAKVLNKKFYASSTVSEGRNLAKKVTYFYLNFILRWSYSFYLYGLQHLPTATSL